MSQRTRVARPPRRVEVPPDDDTDCLICANGIQYAAILPCQHTTCHLCTLRQRALYEKKACLVCRTDNDTVIISEKVDQIFESFSSKDFTNSLDKYGIQFTASYVYEDTMALLTPKCSTCLQVFKTFKDLETHSRVEHNRYYCLICSKNKKAFYPELTTYSHKELQKHQAEGDGKGFKGHPECKFCRGKRFYSEDELNVHIRDRHERCFICDQDIPKEALYYRNYDNLYLHFKRDHYVCSIPACVEKRFVVFREDLDLTAHMLKEHGGLVNNGRVVIGSGFQSQLLTFAPPAAAQEDSLEVKKMRFDERAKHYLNNDADKLKQFNEVNTQFRQRKVSAADVVSKYTAIFKDNQHADISILVYELSELFPRTSDQHKQLADASASLEKSARLAEQFPALGGGGPTFTPNSWGAAPTKKNTQAFPALAKPKRLTTPVIITQPIRYTTIKKPVAQPKPRVVTAHAPANYTPTYLNNLNPVGAVSMPVLGSASSSKSASPASSPGPSINDHKFPALTKKLAKPAIPRVRQVNTGPGVWGGAAPSPAPSSSTDDWGIPIIDKRKAKAKRR